MRSPRYHAADKVLRRRACGVRPVVVAAEVQLQAARERDAVSPVGTANRRPVAGGHPDARCVGRRRRFGRSHLLDGPSAFLPPLGSIPFQICDFLLQIADLLLQHLHPRADRILRGSGPTDEDYSESRRSRCRVKIPHRFTQPHPLVFQWSGNRSPFVLFSHDEFEKAEFFSRAGIPVRMNGTGRNEQTIASA